MLGELICYIDTEKVFAINGRRLCALCGGFQIPFEIHEMEEGGCRMSIEHFLAVASFAVTVFALGYMMGISQRNQK